MKKVSYPLFCAFFLFLPYRYSSAETDPEKFILTGKTNKIPDGTVIYFADILTNQAFDSTTINNNYFKIERVLTVSPTHIFIRNSDYSVSKSIWIENNPMYFDASETDFSGAIVTGSRTQDDYDYLLKQLDTIDSDEEQEKAVMIFISKNTASMVSASSLAGYAPSWGKVKVKELFEGFSKENKESVYGHQIIKFIESNKIHEIGDKYSDFEMKDEKGQVVKLSEKLGRVTLLEFWASWCGPCRQQNPGLVKTYQKYKDNGFEIFSVSLDFKKEDWLKAIEKDQLTWNHVSDLKGRNSTGAIIYGINAIPDNFLIDEKGNIIGKYLWGDDLNQAIENELKKH